MAVDKVTILGLKEAQAAFRRLEPISREAFNEAVAKSAEQVTENARRRLVPGRGFQTGQLQKALGWSINKRSGSAKVGVRLGFETFTPGRNGSAATNAGARAHRPTKIGHLVEFGHRRGASPHPFLVPAAEATKGYFLAQCRAAGSTIERDMASVGGRFS